MANNTIELTNDKTIGVTFNKSENNKIIGAKVTVTGEPTYKSRVLTNGSFNVTYTDGDLWTSTEANNNTYKSFITGSVTEDAAAAAVSSLTDAAVVTQVTTAANPVTAVTVAPANSGSGGGSRKASRRTKNRNSKRRGGRSKRRPRYRSTYR